MSEIISVTVDDAKIQARLDEAPGRIHDELLKTTEGLRLQLEAKIKAKLSGQVLNVVTGNLRRSIFSGTDDQGAQIFGWAKQSGDVKYGAAHEFGFDGDESVKEHVRTIRQAFGREISPKEVIVHAFTRHMRLPERSFMRSTLDDMKVQIIADLESAVTRAIE